MRIFDDSHNSKLTGHDSEVSRTETLLVSISLKPSTSISVKVPSLGGSISSNSCHRAWSHNCTFTTALSWQSLLTSLFPFGTSISNLNVTDCTSFQEMFLFSEKSSIPYSSWTYQAQSLSHFHQSLSLFIPHVQIQCLPLHASSLGFYYWKIWLSGEEVSLKINTHKQCATNTELQPQLKIRTQTPAAIGLVPACKPGPKMGNKWKACLCDLGGNSSPTSMLRFAATAELK